MNGPVIVIQTALFTRDYNYRVAYVSTDSIPTKYRLYLLKLISIFGHFLTVNNRRYGRCYVKIFIPPCTFLEFYAQLEANSAKSFQNAFCKCSRALDIMFLKTSYFWWMSSFFSLSSHLNTKTLVDYLLCGSIFIHINVFPKDLLGKICQKTLRDLK